MMAAPTRLISVETLAPGRAEGASFVLQEPLSFWGGLDVTSGRIIDRWHPQAGEVLSKRILVMDAGRGSSSGSSVLAEAIRLGTGPSGIVLLTRDAIVTMGAIVASELYAVHCPVVLARKADWPDIVSARRLVVSADDEQGSIGIVP